MPGTLLDTTMDHLDGPGDMADMSPSDRSSTEPDSEVLASLPCEKTVRDLERNLICQARGYHQQIAVTNTKIVRKPIVPDTRQFYQIMLQE